jgi:hypothetical protein
MRRLAPLLALSLVAAAPAITEAQVRALLARQEKAWNAGDLTRWAATFSADATFTDQARSNENTIVPYGTSTLAQAEAVVRRTIAKGQGRALESGEVARVTIDGRTAAAVTHVVIRGERRVSCVERSETFQLRGARLVATRQVDTVVRCASQPRPAAPASVPR